MMVLHVQKVAGISGSEAHLLSLLPDLKQRGWDIRFLMLHENEPGAWDFARELEAGGLTDPADQRWRFVTVGPSRPASAPPR